MTAGPAGKSLVDLVLSGELDVLVAAFMPRGFFSPDSPIVPMLPDYRAAEQAYYREHGYIPAHHLIKLHREVVERDPWIVTSLMTAFTESKRLWVERRRQLADTTPWLLPGSGGDGRDLWRRLAAVRPGAEPEDADRLLPGPVSPRS